MTPLTRGTDITWTIPIVDDNGPVDTSQLADFRIDVFYYVGQTRTTWLTFKKTPSATEQPIYSPVPANGELTIVIPRALSAIGPIGPVFAQVWVSQTEASGQYADNEKVVVVLDNATGKDFHTICNLTASNA